MEALILGKQFSHQDLYINIGGVPIVSISDINVDRGRQREFSYGTGKYPTGYGDGKMEPVDLSFTMSKVESDALHRASPGKDVLNLAPFDMPITATGPVPTLIVIKNILLQKVSEKSDTETKEIKHVYTGQAASINFP